MGSIHACVTDRRHTTSIDQPVPFQLSCDEQASKKIVKKKRTGLRQVFKCVQCNNDNVVECVMYVIRYYQCVLAPLTAWHGIVLMCCFRGCYFC